MKLRKWSFVIIVQEIALMSCIVATNGGAWSPGGGGIHSLAGAWACVRGAGRVRCVVLDSNLALSCLFVVACKTIFRIRITGYLHGDPISSEVKRKTLTFESQLRRIYTLLCEVFRKGLYPDVHYLQKSSSFFKIGASDGRSKIENP